VSAIAEHALTGHAPRLLPANAQPLSLREIVRAHHAALIGFLRRRVAIPEDALDVAQETYLRMMKYEGSRQIESPCSMLFRIAANAATDHQRAAYTRHVRNHFDLEGIELASGEPSAERAVAAQQNLQVTWAAIERLPPKCRNVFLLSRVVGMTYPQIARRCGISVKMVEKHISHALGVCEAAAAL
jgi:RNA polymerase sigma-70 factor (ECF subfamily)